MRRFTFSSVIGLLLGLWLIPPLLAQDSQIFKFVAPTSGGCTQQTTVTNSGTWSVPAGVNFVWVTEVGAGGGGGGGHASTGGGGGGGGGGQVWYDVGVPVSPSSTLTLTIPAGGGGGAIGSGGSGPSNTSMTGATFSFPA